MFLAGYGWLCVFHRLVLLCVPFARILFSVCSQTWAWEYTHGPVAVMTSKQARATWNDWPSWLHFCRISFTVLTSSLIIYFVVSLLVLTAWSQKQKNIQKTKKIHQEWDCFLLKVSPNGWEVTLHGHMWLYIWALTLLCHVLLLSHLYFPVYCQLGTTFLGRAVLKSCIQIRLRL